MHLEARLYASTVQQHGPLVEDLKSLIPQPIVYDRFVLHDPSSRTTDPRREIEYGYYRT